MELDDMNEHYLAVLADLRTRKTRLESELRDVDAGIAAIQRLSGAGVPLGSFVVDDEPPPPMRFVPEPPAEPRFGNMSVRWATLWHLAEFADGFDKTGEIARALRAGGYRTEASHFGNMVSAVLSKMRNDGEVETNEDGGYRLTEKGRQTWQLIRQGSKFKNAVSGATSESPLLAAQ
jgi:hypothetical protein